jgi:hypothetical protein
MEFQRNVSNDIPVDTNLHHHHWVNHTSWNNMRISFRTRSVTLFSLHYQCSKCIQEIQDIWIMILCVPVLSTVTVWRMDVTWLFWFKRNYIQFQNHDVFSSVVMEEGLLITHPIMYHLVQGGGKGAFSSKIMTSFPYSTFCRFFLPCKHKT